MPGHPCGMVDPAVDVITVVEAAMERYGMPKHIRSDNGLEFLAYAIKDWLEERKIKTIYIKPGSPWENGHIESFHDKFRDEFLNREIFGSLLEAKVLAEHWRIEYNQERPHSSLGYQTPDEFAESYPTPLRPTLRQTTSTQTTIKGQNSTFDLSRFRGHAKVPTRRQDF